jgi:hypothetical protein
MKDPDERKPMSGAKKAAIAAGAFGGGVLAGGAHAMLKGRVKKVRIGTPVSKVSVVRHMPIKLRQATGRVVSDLSERIEGHLHEFEAVDLREEPYSGCDPDAKPCFPSLYLSGKKDKGLMNLPTVGKAMIDYKVKRRHVDESREDGVPRYGADIEIQSIEHVEMPEEDEEEGAELSRPLSIREFGSSGQASLRRKMVGLTKDGDFTAARKIQKKAAIIDRKKSIVIPSGRLDPALGGLFKQADAWDKANKALPSRRGLAARIDDHLREFAGERERDPAGRFAAGRVPSPDDFAIASQARKKKAAAGVAAGVATAGAMATRPGRAAASSIGAGLVRTAGRMFR